MAKLKIKACRSRTTLIYLLFDIFAEPLVCAQLAGTNLEHKLKEFSTRIEKFYS